jgi:hypothetical protein
MEKDAAIRFGAVTQNHLPPAAAPWCHPHLQVQADALGPALPKFCAGGKSRRTKVWAARFLRN